MVSHQVLTQVKQSMTICHDSGGSPEFSGVVPVCVRSLHDHFRGCHGWHLVHRTPRTKPCLPKASAPRPSVSCLFLQRRRMRSTAATGGLKLHLRMNDATTELAGTLNPLLLFASISSYTMLCTKNTSISTRSGSSRCCNIIRTRGCPAYKMCHCCKTAAVVSQGMAKVRLMCLHCQRLT